MNMVNEETQLPMDLIELSYNPTKGEG
jgi:hypothetical protein